MGGAEQKPRFLIGGCDGRGKEPEPSHNKKESADKPGFVEDNHSSGIYVAIDLKRPTREPAWAMRANYFLRSECLFPYLVLLRAGFTVPSSVTTDAVRSYRTLSPLPLLLAQHLGGLLSVALSVDSRPPGVTWRFARRARTFLHSSLA